MTIGGARGDKACFLIHEPREMSNMIRSTSRIGGGTMKEMMTVHGQGYI